MCVCLKTISIVVRLIFYVTVPNKIYVSKYLYEWVSVLGSKSHCQITWMSFTQLHISNMKLFRRKENLKLQAIFC